MADEADRSSTPRGWWLLAVVAIVAVAALVWALAAGRSPTDPPIASSPATSTAMPTSTVMPTSTAAAGSPQSSSVPTPAPSPTPVLPPVSPGATADPPPPRVTQAPVALDAVAVTGADLRVELTSIEAVTGLARTPGEVGGPALRVTVEATNEADAAFATPAAVVNLYFGADRRPANTIREPGGRPLPHEIAAHDFATGVYLFTVPENARDDILVEIELQVGEPIVLFQGAFAP